FIFLITVDGRRPGHSIGMSLYELSEFMLELGCEEAMNLDGGGSTTMWINGKIRNRPSDGIVRPIANAILIYSSKPLKK
ncbi:MAG: phosphodiester glycosidase family protein, partial [bacterium]|nr:phosphodiester glycosidase family protein [bacterium]